MARRKAGWRLVCMLAAMGTLAATPICAQQPQSFDGRWQAVPVQHTPAKPPSKAAAKRQAKLPVSVPQALYLIRSTLLTLNDANRTGNYTVLHDLSAPGFKAKNSPADLAQIFVNLRKQHFDLFAVALEAPKLSAPPRLEANGMLRLTGYFPTRPLQINFDLLFQDVEHEWRLFGISVATPQAPPVVARRAEPPTKRKTRQ
jgi:hypothetical protein